MEKEVDESHEGHSGDEVKARAGSGFSSCQDKGSLLCSSIIPPTFGSTGTGIEESTEFTHQAGAGGGRVGIGVDDLGEDCVGWAGKGIAGDGGTAGLGKS